jgi:O-antigen/teichoic acid export membrane protein
MVFSDLIIHFISFLILRKTFEKLELCWSQDYSIILGLIYLKKSLWLMLKYLLDSIRNIGIRVLLSRDLSTSKIALFSTHRTPSNVFVQAINSLTYSMQPELMLSIRDREDTKIYFYNTFLWLILSILILPIIYIIQALMPAIFEIWTMGKLTFDPIIFSIFLIIAIIYTVYSPFEAIMKGNNLGKKLSLVSIISSLTLIVFIYLSIKEYEILGASISLLISEIVVLILNSYFAINWLRDNKFNTTYIAFILIMINLLINSIILFYISKNGFNLLFCLSGISISITISIGIWYTYTPEVRKKILKFIKVK